jgi:hypothetical protein
MFRILFVLLQFSCVMWLLNGIWFFFLRRITSFVYWTLLIQNEKKYRNTLYSFCSKLNWNENFIFLLKYFFVSKINIKRRWNKKIFGMRTLKWKFLMTTYRNIFVAVECYGNESAIYIHLRDIYWMFSLLCWQF